MTEPKRILIVEDEPLIAMMLEDFLDELGHEVAGTADCAAAALPLIETGALDAAILDVNLRGGEHSGAIADALAERSIPFLFATGGSGDDVGARHADRPRLMKPYTIASVERALDEL